MNIFKSLGFANKAIYLTGLAGLVIVCIAIEQQLRNREIVRSCTARTHKIVYVSSPLGDQALCVHKHALGLLIKTAMQS